MSATADPNQSIASPPDQQRRDFLLIATATVGAVGTALAAWPFIDSMNPAKDTLAVATSDIDLAPIDVGQRITVVWRGKPVFIDHRTPERIAVAKADDDADLPIPKPTRPGCGGRNGSSLSGSAPTWAVFPWVSGAETPEANMVDGSAPATAPTTTRRGGSERGPRHSTCIFRRIPLSTRRACASDERDERTRGIG